MDLRPRLPAHLRKDPSSLRFPSYERDIKKCGKGRVTVDSYVVALKTASARGGYRWIDGGAVPPLQRSHIPDSQAQTCPDRECGRWRRASCSACTMREIG